MNLFQKYILHKTLYAVFALILGIVTLQSQDGIPKDLHQWVQAQQLLLQEDAKQFLENAQALQTESARKGDTEAELTAIEIQCTYYKVRNDFDQMLQYSKLLLRKSKEHQNRVFEVKAQKHLFESLAFSGLVEEAFDALQKGTKLAEQLSDVNDENILTKSDIYIANSNYHNLQNDYENQFKYIQLAGVYFKKIQDEAFRDRLLYIHNCNLAGVYLQLGKKDSAQYYAELSLSQEKNYDRVDIQFNNYSILGNIAFAQSDNEKALEYYQKAENLDGYKNHLNTEQLYEKIINVYQTQGDLVNRARYQSKLDSLQLIITQNQNKSLHALLKEKEIKTETNSFWVYGLISGFIIVFSLILLNLLKRKKRKNGSEENLAKEEKLTDEELEKLFELLKENDPAFIVYFNEKFEEFTLSLQALNPTLSSSELEICAMMKLKIPTKKIAQYKFIAPKTVQNKKHIIRKKLNIPSEVDLYDWMNEI